MDVNGEIIRMIADYKDLPPDTVTPERTFEELGIDSLDAIDIIYEVEDKFQVEISQDELNMQELQRVGDIAALVQRVVAEQQSGAA